MRYGIAEFKDVGNLEIAPDVPPGVLAGHVAHPNDRSWGFFEIEVREGPWPPEGVLPADQELCWLLYSAKMYLPALVLAIEDMGSHLGTKTEYLDALKVRLKIRLANQKSDPYILARTQETDGELVEGSWHWAVGYDRVRNEVHWVSPYYFVYYNRRSCFELSESELELLPAVGGRKTSPANSD